MRASVEFKDIVDVAIGTKINNDGELIAVIKSEVKAPNPLDLARLAQMLKSRLPMELHLISPQAAMDFYLIGDGQVGKMYPEEMKSLPGGAMEIPCGQTLPPLAPQTPFTPLSYDLVGDDDHEHPYRVKIGEKVGAGETPSDAVLEALFAANLIPAECKPDDVIDHLLTTYENVEDGGNLDKLVWILLNDSFDVPEEVEIDYKPSEAISEVPTEEEPEEAETEAVEAQT